ncbi:MAG: glycosyltransferase [Candidatus Sulfotelmatobacter sp.]
MDITVILCTFNRSQSLSKALASIAVQELPHQVTWEVLVVDNNSRDQTRSVVEEFCRKYPNRYRYVFEPRQGKSHALNAGIREASGEVLAFLDDDVMAEPTWLQNLTVPLRQGECAGVGGRILPEKTFTPPHWIPLQERYALAPLAVFTPDLEAGPFTDAPFGANMAFQKRVFEKHGGFRTDLGPQPGGIHPQKSEDSEFGHRVLGAGEKLRYEPSAVVYHVVPASRVRKGYFLAWWSDKARSDIRAFGVPTDTSWLVAGVPLYLFRRLAVWSLRWLVTLEPSRRFSCQVKAWSNFGQIVECYQQAHGGKVAVRTEQI